MTFTGGAALIAGRTFLVVAAEKLAAGGAGHQVGALAGLAGETSGHGGTALPRPAVHVDDGAGLAGATAHLLARVTASALAAARGICNSQSFVLTNLLSVSILHQLSFTNFNHCSYCKFRI